MSDGITVGKEMVDANYDSPAFDALRNLQILVRFLSRGGFYSDGEFVYCMFSGDGVCRLGFAVAPKVIEGKKIICINEWDGPELLLYPCPSTFNDMIRIAERLTQKDTVTMAGLVAVQGI